MRKSLKVSRGLQLIGALALVSGIVACSERSDPYLMSLAFIAGITLILGARIYEWLSKE
jgi:hypothetical protein